MLAMRWIGGSAALALACALGACGGSGHETTSSNGATTGTTGGSGTTGTTGTTSTGGGATTGPGSTTTGTGGGATTGTGAGGGGTACTPAPGSAMVSVGCDLLQMAVMQGPGGGSELVLTGRLFGESASMPSCAAIDGVDILSGAAGSMVVQHLAGGASVTIDAEDQVLGAAAPPAADIVSRCASDDPSQRFDVYGIVVSGRVDGGTFQAQCALAEGGTRWPPALRVTCHKNVDQPGTNANVSVMTQSFMGMSFTTTQLFAEAPHGPGGALQTLDPTLFVIAQREPLDPGPPIPSHATTGWMTDVTETMPPTGPASQLSFAASSDVLGPDLCPAAPSGPPGPGTISPPAFIARATGTGQHGPFSTEVFLTGCLAESIP